MSSRFYLFFFNFQWTKIKTIQYYNIRLTVFSNFCRWSCLLTETHCIYINPQIFNSADIFFPVIISGHMSGNVKNTHIHCVITLLIKIIIIKRFLWTIIIGIHEIIAINLLGAFNKRFTLMKWVWTVLDAYRRPALGLKRKQRIVIWLHGTRVLLRARQRMLCEGKRTNAFTSPSHVQLFRSNANIFQLPRF